MNDSDADEIVRQRKHGPRVPMIDKALGATGLLLAALAAFFPWYAFLNQDKFTMPTAWEGTAREMHGKMAAEGSPPASTAMLNPGNGTNAAVDQLLTATVPDPLAKTPDDAGVEQPFPSATNFRLMHVANGMALIEDGSGMYIVKVGSALPDDSKLETLEQRDGRWVMITSKGIVTQAQ